MKILHLADLHMNSNWLGWVTEEASRFDLVVLAGDMLDAFANRSMADTTSLGTTSGLSLSVTGLSPNTTYAMKVQAYDAAGNPSGWSSKTT